MLKIFKGRRDLVISISGRMVSAFGDGVALVALTLRLQAEGAHPYEVGLLLAAGVLPLLGMARFAGRLADTHDSRQILVWAGLAEVAATVPLIFLSQVIPIVLLVAVLGAASSVTSATWAALLPRLVGEEHVAKAVSAQQSLGVLAVVGAPAIGGLLAGIFGSGVPVALDAVSYLVLTLAAALIRTRRIPERVAEQTGSSRLQGGLAILRADRLLAPLFAGVALVVLLVGMVDVVLVFLVRDTLHASASWYGLAMASWMAGMVAGSVGAGRVGTESGQVWATIAGMALLCVCLASFAAAPVVWILVPLSILGGAGNGYAGTCLSTLLLLRAPEQARGRVSAVATAVLGGAQGTSLLLGGVVALALSPREVYALAGLLGLGTALVLALGTASGVFRPGRAADAHAS